MSDADRETKERNREIAHNESVRQTTSAIRVSCSSVKMRCDKGPSINRSRYDTPRQKASGDDD